MVKDKQNQTKLHTADDRDVEAMSLDGVKFAQGEVGLRALSNGEMQPTVVFPSVSKLACSFDQDLLREVGSAIGEQCRASGVDVMIAPIANVKRSPLGGRNYARFSEDPLLTAELANAYIAGINSQGVGVCVGDFATSSQQYGRLVCDNVVDERALREIYLSAFEKIVKKSNPCCVMCASAKLNGEYSHLNKWLTSDVLRKEFGYDGVVLANPDGYSDTTLTTVETTDEQIAALKKKFAGGSRRNVDLDYQHALAARISAECTVLAKNNCNLLPLDKADDVAVIGALAETPYIQGDCVKPYQSDSILQALTDSGIAYAYSQGYNLDGSVDVSLIEQAQDLAATHDKVLLIVGVTNSAERDMDSFSLPACQLQLIDAVTNANGNVVTVLQCPSAVDVSWAHACKALVVDYYGGESGGRAMVNILFGDSVPMGRLAESWPLSLPEYQLNFSQSYKRELYNESIFVGYRYYTTANATVAFPFGHGLSYNEIKWTKPTIGQSVVLPMGKITVEVTLHNVGKQDDAEVVQLYATNLDGRDYYAAKNLVAFKKVKLKPKEKKKVTLSVPVSEFASFNTDSGRFEVNGGNYLLTLGRDCNDERYKFTVTIEGANDTRDKSDELGCFYNLGEDFNPSEQQFATLCGKEFVSDGSTFTTTSTLDEAQNTFVGKTLAKRLLRDCPTELVRTKMAYPLRAFVSDNLSSDMLDTIVDMLNGQVVKNLFKLFKQYLACKRVARKKAKETTQK